MSATVANALDAVTRLVDKLAHDLPRNIDVATLRYYMQQLAAATMQRPHEADPLLSALTHKRARHRRPGYWAERKRAQRARAKTANS